jgi:hypothetical protein
MTTFIALYIEAAILMYYIYWIRCNKGLRETSVSSYIYLMQKLSYLPQFIGDPLFDLGCLCLHLFGVLQS